MPKGYWVARVDVSDIEQYKRYVAANAAPFAQFGARFLVRGGPFEAMEGSSRSRKVRQDITQIKKRPSGNPGGLFPYELCRDPRLDLVDARIGLTVSHCPVPCRLDRRGRF